MRRLLLILALFVPAVAAADVFPHYGWCQYGGQTVTVQGLSSTGDVQASYPGCTVNVFVIGTGTHATLFSDSAGTLPLSNPFTADTGIGYYTFYTAQGCYDVVTSGASIPSPHTDTICLASSTSTGTVTNVSATNNAGGLISVGVTNPTTTPVLTFGLTQFPAHSFWGNGTGSTATPSATVIGVADLPFTYTGNTTKLVTAGSVSGTGSPLCTDASGNATTSGCPSSSGYTTVQDEGSPLTQRTTLNFTGSGITCTDDSGGSRTHCDVPASTISGSGTTGDLAFWSSSSTLGDTNWAVGSGTLQTSAAMNISTGNVGSGNSPSIIIESGVTSSSSSSNQSGQVSFGSSPSSAGAKSGSLKLFTGDTSGLATAGDITLSPGNNSGVTDGGNLVLLMGIGSSKGGIVNCGNSSASTNPGCSIVMGVPGNSGAAVGLMAGTGVPSGSCQAPLVRANVGLTAVFYLRTDTSLYSDTMYGCISGTWRPLATLFASLTTTAATTDNVTVTGMTSSGHCTLSPTNSSAATNIATTFISAKTTNQITVTHTATGSMTYDILCTAY